MALQVPPHLVAQALRISVKGQDHVVPGVAQLLVNGEAGYSRRGRPRGTFLFLGPTGVGKTEVTKCMSELLYGHREMNGFDMGGYSDQLDAERFKGDLAARLDGLEGGGLLLFDEIEKAHKTIVDLFLAITDEARFVYERKAYDLSDFYVVCTSNLGCREIIAMKESDISVIERFARQAAAEYFRPEGLVRFKNISVFNLLGYDVQLMICQGMLNQFKHFLEEEHNILLETTHQSVLFLIEVGVNPALGARELFNAIELRIPAAITRHDKRIGRDLNDKSPRSLLLDLAASKSTLTVREIVDEQLKQA